MVLRGKIAVLLLAGALVSGCVSGGPSPGEITPQPATYSIVGLENVMGATAASLIDQFGRPDLDLREGSARKLQFLSPACVFDAYLYPPRGGGDSIVTYVDARLPDGREMDRASCAAALSRRDEAR